MITWTIRRLFQACFVVVAMTVIVFVGVHVIGNPVDILISDIKMPDLSGVDVLRAAKKIDQDILGIMITAFASTETAVEAMRLGACDYLSKPFDIDLLISVTDRFGLRGPDRFLKFFGETIDVHVYIVARRPWTRLRRLALGRTVILADPIEMRICSMAFLRPTSAKLGTISWP